MNILFFASDYKIGLSTLLTDQLLALHRNGINVYPVAGEKNQEKGLEEQIIAQKIQLKRIHGLDDNKNFFRLVNDIKEIIQTEDIRLVHVQNNWQLAIIAVVKLKLYFLKKIKIIYTLHGFRHNSFIKSIMAQFIIGTALFLFADKVICMCQYLKKKFRFLSYKIIILPLGVADMFFQDKRPNTPKNGLQIIFPAQFRNGKNQDLIIKAFAKHIHENKDSESYMILPGNGPLWEDMKKLASALYLQDRISFPGLCSKRQTKELYLQSNIGIVSSNSETFGQSIVEPFVLGRCILTTAVGVAPDIIATGKNGFFFRNQDELAILFDKLYKDQSIIDKTGENNFLKGKMFQWDNIIQDYKKQILNN